jgi:3' terminal RNA ribose 2'-O-methyltransferase Hen1
VQLTITTTHYPATDLGFLLHKNPAKVQSFAQKFGQAHVLYPEATDRRCTMALILDVDAVGLIRGRNDSAGFALEQYVNDRPYTASSFLSVALGEIFGSAMAGRCKDRPELAELPIPLEARLSVVACRGGPTLLHRLFEPLGYTVEAAPYPLDRRFPDWGESPYYTLTLRAEIRLRELLTHLYVLIPVLDNDKHYWVGDDEVEKLLRRGEGWLAGHPERELITHRYLKHRRSLTQDALARLAEGAAGDAEDVGAELEKEEATVDRRLHLHGQRLQAVAEALRDSGAKRVLDLGCGEGMLLKILLADRAFDEIVGVDVSYRALERAKDRLNLDRLLERQRQRIALLHGSLTYRDRRLEGYDGAAVVEVIEHLDYPRLAAFERVLFEFARPRLIALTTPNQEYNRLFESLLAGAFRHKDHRFEWTREQFQEWASMVAGRYGYSVGFSPIGPENAEVGAPSQMALFTLGETA